MSRLKDDSLFKLIKSLIQTEKRYFKRFASLHGDSQDNNYMRLFEVIDSQDKYDEKRLKGKFEGELFIKRLDVTKKYLFNLILKSLQAYHSNVSVIASLKNNIQQLTILYEKGLFTESYHILLKAKEVAIKFEKFIQLLEILEWEKDLLRLNGGMNSTKLEEVINEEKETLSKIKNEKEYNSIRANLFQRYVSSDIARNEKEKELYKKCVENELLQDENLAITFNSKYDFLYTYSLYYHTIGELKNCYIFQKKLLHFMEQHVDQINEQPTKYITALTNYYNICALTNNYSECSSIISKIRLLPSKSIRMDVLIFSSSISREFDLYLNTGDNYKGIALVNEVERGLKLYGNLIPRTVIITLYFDIAYLFFGVNDYSSSLAWLNKIFNNTDLRSSRSDIYCFALILNLIVHYEMGNTELLEYIVKSTYRFLYKRNHLYKFETAILNYIRISLPKANTKKKVLEAFKNLKLELEIITQDSFEFQAYRYFDLISWLESKIEERPFIDIVKEKVLEKKL